MRENMWQTKQALIYVSLHISQRGWVLVNTFYSEQMFKLQISSNYGDI